MDLNALIIRITNLQQELAGYLPLRMDVQEKLDKKFRLEFNYNSNHIEGNTLTYGETELCLIFDKAKGNHDLREYDEMRASDAALKMIQEYAAEKERPLTEAFIKSLNELILVKPYWADAITHAGQPSRKQIIPGGYKKQPNSVLLQNGEEFKYTSPEETPIQMGELMEWYRSEKDRNELKPVELAAQLHYKFVRIHPFDDGNGRISRLLMNYVLYANKLPPVVVKSADKKNYRFALNQADAGDINAFVEYIARQLVWSLELSIKAAKGESIEEQDDLEKEIEVWKKGLKGKNPDDVVEKSQSIIDKIYLEQLEPFFTSFANKLGSLTELFANVRLNIYINNGAVEFDNVKSVNVIFSGIQHPSLQEPQNIYSVEMIISMDGFKKYHENPFSTKARISISFQQYNYEIIVSAPQNIVPIKKSYKSEFTSEEQDLIVENAKRSLFEYIKSQPEKR